MVERYERGIEDGGVTAWFGRTFDLSSVLWAACAFVVVILAILVCSSLSGCKRNNDGSIGTYGTPKRAFVFYPGKPGYEWYQVDPNYDGWLRYPIAGSGGLSSVHIITKDMRWPIYYFYSALPGTENLLPIMWTGEGYVVFFEDGEYVVDDDGQIIKRCTSPAFWPGVEEEFYVQVAEGE